MTRPILLGDMPHMIEARGIEDDWAGISDLAARKKRQNRLNQRALRRRREAIKSAHLQRDHAEPIQSGLPLIIERQGESTVRHSSHTIRLDVHSTWMTGQQATLEQVGHQTTRWGNPSPISRSLNGSSPLRFGWVSDEEGTTLAVSLGPTTIVLDLYSCSLPADHLISLQRYNLYRACATIVEILGVDSRSLHDDITSPFCDLGAFNRPLPDSLVPTETQVRVQHPPYMDIFPLSSMRDRIILLAGTFDEDELCADIGGKNPTTEHTGMLVWGDPWDPMGWELSEYVAIKWAWLLDGCEELFTATDYWRGQRGEAPLADAIRRSRRVRLT
ncbi:hypothetical protein F5Y14DRAFT_241727 [Nemania sp. NC0429]|nr:hypothetical protein F5Y14DRAFT_241727 [Nemania sp. NC0429]